MEERQKRFNKEFLTCKRCGSSDVRTDQKGIVTCRKCSNKWVIFRRKG